MEIVAAKQSLLFLAREQAKIDKSYRHDIELFDEELIEKELQVADSTSPRESNVVVDLQSLTAKSHTDEQLPKRYKKKVIYLEHGSEDPHAEQRMFPLAVDDYFMSVAILAKHLSDVDKPAAACVVSAASFRVYSIGYKKEGTRDCAVKIALKDACKKHTDLTKCHLYTTSKKICKECTIRIVVAGIKVIVHNGDIEMDKKEVYHQACFKKYGCRIRTKNKSDRYFQIDLSNEKVANVKLEMKKANDPTGSDPDQTGYTGGDPDQTGHTGGDPDQTGYTGGDPDQNGGQSEVEPNQRPETKEISTQTARAKRPSYQDFFMAMAFLAQTRSKDRKYKVGACLVTSSPHRLVAMAYNGMPDGRGFKDSKMDWGSKQRDHNCHSEVNVIIAAFRREADLSDCTLYVTYSPCHDCSKLIAQSGIKNVVFAKYYHNGESMYETLGRLPDMHITRYEYMETGYRNEHGNIARMTISLEDLTINLNTSHAVPETRWKMKYEMNGKIEKTISCCPSCSREQYNKKECEICPTCKQFHPLQPVEEPKGFEQVDLPLDDYYMSIAVLASSRSRLPKKRGACIVYLEPRRVISVGYNGHINGMTDGRLEKEDYICCAEFNAIVSAYRYHADLTNATLYTTGYPCARCAIKIVQSGMKTVVYGGKPEKKDDEEFAPAEDTFYWGNISTLKYESKLPKPYIEIDLKRLTVRQNEKQSKEECPYKRRHSFSYRL